MAIGILCGINAVAQTAQGLTGFDLPSSPLLVFQALCFGVLVVMPLQLTDNAPVAYETFAPIEQAGARSFDAIAIALLVPLLILTIVRQSETGWAVWYFVGVASVLLLLALGRGKLAMRQTRRLYEEVERSAGARRQMLADVLQSADHDRHRVAAQLHQQATGFYVAFMSFLRVIDDSQTNPALRGTRDDLENTGGRTPRAHAGRAPARSERLGGGRPQSDHRGVYRQPLSRHDDTPARHPDRRRHGARLDDRDDHHAHLARGAPQHRQTRKRPEHHRLDRCPRGRHGAAGDR